MAPFALAACGVVTADDSGLFASVASAPDGAAGGSAAGGGPGGGSAGNTGVGTASPISQADSCDNAFPISLSYGSGTSLFRGAGDTKGDTAPAQEAACEADTRVVADGPDRVHAITVNAPQGGYLTARLLRGGGKTEFDSILYLRNVCAGGAGTVCEDSFSSNLDGEREAVNGGDFLSVPVPASIAPTTLFLFVDGVGATSGGRYELEVSLNKGDCADPIPVFVEPGSPVRARITDVNAQNIVTLSCGAIGSFDVILRVTRAIAGPMGVTLKTNDSDLAIALMDQTCDGKGGDQVERPGQCETGAGAVLDEAAWPDAQRSVFVAVDAGRNPRGRIIPIEFDPGGAPSGF